MVFSNWCVETTQPRMWIAWNSSLCPNVFVFWVSLIHYFNIVYQRKFIIMLSVDADLSSVSEYAFIYVYSTIISWHTIPQYYTVVFMYS
jgi:hypothetical protein